MYNTLFKIGAFFQTPLSLQLTKLIHEIDMLHAIFQFLVVMELWIGFSDGFHLYLFL